MKRGFLHSAQCCGSTGTGTNVRAELPRYKTLLLSHNKTCFLNVFYSAEYFQCTGTGSVSAESPDYKYPLCLIMMAPVPNRPSRLRGR